MGSLRREGEREGGRERGREGGRGGGREGGREREPPSRRQRSDLPCKTDHQRRPLLMDRAPGQRCGQGPDARTGGCPSSAFACASGQRYGDTPNRRTQSTSREGATPQALPPPRAPPTTAGHSPRGTPPQHRPQSARCREYPTVNVPPGPPSVYRRCVVWHGASGATHDAPLPASSLHLGPGPCGADQAS